MFTRNTLFDEKIGGTRAPRRSGPSYPETGGLNRSALHWDSGLRPRSGSESIADGELVYRDGRLLERFGLTAAGFALACICRCDGREARVGRSGEGLEAEEQKAALRRRRADLRCADEMTRGG